MNISLPPASWRTLWVFVACFAPMVYLGASDGYLLTGLAAAAIGGPVGLAYLWVARGTVLAPNFWDLGGENA